MSDNPTSSSFHKTKMLSCFDIQLDPSNPQKVYMPGDQIVGTVQLLAQEQVTIDIFSVNLIGEYYAFNGEKEECEPIATDSFLMDLSGGGEGGGDAPFSLRLPPTCPASLATPLGGIRYKVSGTLMGRRPAQSSAAQAAEKTVFISVNLPKKIELNKSGRRQYVDDRTFCSCCFGGVTGEFEVTESEFLCGSRAVINAYLDNFSTRPISMTSVSLIQRVTRKKDGKLGKYEVAKTERGSVMTGNRQVWLAERFLIPALPPTSTDSYFSISYEFLMSLQKSPSKRLKMKIPIVIGNFASLEPPKSWKDPDGVDFWSHGDHRMKVTHLPLYVTYIF